MQSVLENEDLLNKRVFQFPTSAVKFKQNERRVQQRHMSFLFLPASRM